MGPGREQSGRRSHGPGRVTRGRTAIRQRRLGRRYQRWTEVEPEEDYARWAGVGTAVAVTLFVLVIALVVVGLVFAR
jgi:hypothetical protein